MEALGLYHLFECFNISESFADYNKLQIIHGY
jgi:hypothetical protein